VWHVHNHALGKNASLPRAVARLARSGRRLLLQIHDFAEDGRPANYRFLVERVANGDRSALGSILYPQAPHVQYAVLNTRDRAFLGSAGVSPSRLHLLPNAVSLDPPAAPDAPPGDGNRDERLVLYPTRAIRRKNLGEFLLWSARGGPGERYATTLAPQNPAARPVYDRWVSFAASLGLPAAFNVGEGAGASFTDLLRRAAFLVTTSVAEGFGLCFLEPWLAGRPLAGRNLPETTGQFAAAGLDLSGLYDRLEVPAAWIDEKTLRAKVERGLGALLRAYGREPRRADVDRACAAFGAGSGRIDFGRLDEELQERIIRRVAGSAAAREELRPRQLEPSGDQTAQIAANRRVVREAFGLAAYGERLADIYRAVAASPVESVEALPAGALLDRFIDPARFSLLRAV
jgi:hypothetical protein